MKNLSKRTRLTLLISLFFVTTTQVVTPIHGMGVLSGAYSAYKANKLKNDFLSAVSCTIKPWTCKAGRITLMAATFALMMYIMHSQRSKGPLYQAPEDFESEGQIPVKVELYPRGVLAAAEEKPRISVEDFKTFVLEKNPSYSAQDIVELFNNIQRMGLGAEYYQAVASFFQNNPGRLEEGAMEDAKAELAAASSAAQ